jgi:hypothetical protein
LPVDTFIAVLLLFGSKHIFNKVLLQDLVSEIDAQLLEAVFVESGDGLLEDLEAKDIEDAQHLVGWVLVLPDKF